jgi:hypothetical protein
MVTDAPKETAEIKTQEAAETDTEDAEVDPFGISEEYINMGIALVTPIDKLLKLIEESPWRRMLDASGKYVTGQEKSSVIVVIDTTTGELIAKVDTVQPPALGESTASDSPETD